MGSINETLLALADRCEREEASRELDAEIFRATGWEGVNMAYVPEFGTSLDAAVTLVPEGWHTSLIMHHMLTSQWEHVLRRDRNADCEQGWAKTEAMARCAAALRARAAVP